jgi:hypothetical protein
MKNHLLLGDWNALCDSCGRKFKASSLQKRWDGLIVCREDWEQRHPQDLLRVQREQISVPWARPYPAEDTYITKFGLVDTAQMHDYHEEGDYVDAGYFLSDYISDFYIITKWVRQFNDQLDILEQLATSFKRPLADSVSFSDNITVVRRFVRTFADTATPSDAAVITFKQALTDITTIAEALSIAMKYNISLADSFVPTESSTLKVTKALTDTVSVSEALSTLLKIFKAFADTVSLADSGNVLLKNYVDPTYFEADYVGTSTTF